MIAPLLRALHIGHCDMYYAAYGDMKFQGGTIAIGGGQRLVGTELK